MKLSSYSPMREHEFSFIFVMSLYTIINFEVNNSEFIFVSVIIVEFVIKFHFVREIRHTYSLVSYFVR